jgi:hypothetical protein
MNWSSEELQQHVFKDIDRTRRIKLMEIIVDIAINAGKTGKEEKEKFIIRGVLQYYAKLFRVIFLTNINTLSSETCKVISSLLQELKNFLVELQQHLKCDNRSYLGKMLRWSNRFWQLMILIKDIPNLPDLDVD